MDAKRGRVGTGSSHRRDRTVGLARGSGVQLRVGAMETNEQPSEQASVPVEGSAQPPGTPPVLWEAPPPPRRWGRRLLIVGLAVVVLAFVGYGGLIFLGGQVEKVLAGQVEFGTGAPSGCAVAGSATEFPVGTALYWGAYLRNEAPAGTTLVIEESKDGQVVGRTEYSTKDATNCLATSNATDPLPVGTYSIRILRDSNEEASGTITIR
jgi:hypothetical protein